MKSIEISDEVHATLFRLAKDRNQPASDVLATLLGLPPSPEIRSNPLITHLLKPEATNGGTDAERYLAILAWVAARHPGDFREFVQSLTSGRRFLGLTRDEIVAQCRHNQARSIPGTSYWAIMNLDTPTKRRFLARVLEFTDYPEEVIAFACESIGRGQFARRPSVLAA